MTPSPHSQAADWDPAPVDTTLTRVTKLKVASGQVLDGRSIEVPTLSVELTDLGKSPKGATVAEVSAEVIQTVKKRATAALSRWSKSRWQPA